MTRVTVALTLAIGYMDIPWLERHCLGYMDHMVFVHCGGTFQTLVQAIVPRLHSLMFVFFCWGLECIVH